MDLVLGVGYISVCVCVCVCVFSWKLGVWWLLAQCWGILLHLRL